MKLGIIATSIPFETGNQREEKMGDAGDGGAGVDDEVVPRELLGGIVDEITDDRSQSRVSRARIPQRDSFLRLIFQPLLLHEPGSDLGLEQSGGYGVDPDLERPQLGAHHPGQTVDSSLGCRVVQSTGLLPAIAMEEMLLRNPRDLRPSSAGRR